MYILIIGLFEVGNFCGSVTLNYINYCSTGCFKMNFTMVFQMLLCGEYYENVYTLRRTNSPSFKMLNDG
jgi:hypothetical protein